MKKYLLIILSLTLVFTLILSSSYAASIKLKNGQSVEGKILEKTNSYIKIDFYGVPLTYFLDQIDTIDGEHVYAPAASQVGPTYAREPKQIFQEISPAVVYITTRTVVEEEYLGSGFIIDSEGVVITNYHVIQSAKDINVRLKDGTSYPASGVIYYDANQDACILKINANNLPTIPLGDSSNLQIGEKIYCIGNPLGLEYSFSDGLLSGVRDYQELKYLQFTAPVSPGNSGGPLINPQGEAIGIVTFLLVGGQNLNFALAINEIKPFISQYPKMTFQQFVENVSQADYYLIQGNNYVFQGDYNSAITSYQKALEINPRLVEAYNYIGLAYGYLGQNQEAISCFQKAIQINPNFVTPYNNIGYAYDSLGQYDQAIAYYQKALQLDPNYAAAYNNLGSTYSNLGQFQQALPYFQKAIQMDPSLAVAYDNLGSAYNRLGQYQQAITYCQKALQIDPNYASAYSNLASTYNKLGQYQQAISYLEKAIQMDPNLVEACNNFGYAYIGLGQYDQAIFYLQKALQIDPSLAEAYVNLGFAYYNLHRYSEAKENLLKAKELYQRKGDYEAIKDIDENLKKLP